MTKANKLMCAVAAAWMIGMAPALQADPPAVVRQIPEEAQAFIAMPNLSDLSEKLTRLNQQTGLNRPELTDPLASARMMLGLERGLDQEGGAAIVVMSLPDGQGDEPEMILLLPVDDYDDFLGNFGAEGGDEEVTQGEWQGETIFVKNAGDYAVLSDQRERIVEYEAPDGNGFEDRAGEFGEGVLSDAESLIYIDLAKIGPVLQPMLDQGMEDMERQMGNQEAAAALPIMRIYGEVAEALLRDGQSALIGLDLGDEGVGLTFTGQFKPDSPLAQAFSESPDEAPSLDRLPDRPFLFAAATDLSTLPVEEWLEELTEALPENNWLTELLTASLSAMELTGGRQQQAWYAAGPGGGGMPGLFNAVTVDVTDQPDELIQKNKEILTGLNEIDLGDAEGAAPTVTYEEDVMQVAGRQVDQYNMTFNLPPEAMEQMGPLAMLLGQGLGGYVTSTEDAVITTSGADPVMLREAIEAAGGDGGGLDENGGIAAIRENLPEHRIAETYIGIGSILETAGMFMGMFMPGVEFDPPADLPPVAVGISVNNGGIAERVYVPVPVIKAITDIVRSFQNPGAGGDPFAGDAGNEARNRPSQTAEPAGENIIELTDDNFQNEVTESDRPVLVDFWAAWADPAKEQAPIISALADRFGGRVLVGKIDIDKNPRTSGRYDIEYAPTLLVFKGGEVVGKFVGLTPENKLAAALEEAAR